VPDEEEIEEEIKVEFDVEVTEDTKVEEIVIAPVEEKEDVDQIFLVVEETATPKGGMSAFYKYVGDKMKYPAQARRMGIEGKVFVEFVINRDGSITDVKAIKGIGAGCDEEAVRVVQSAPPWNPGKQRGKPVRQRYVVPITFKLG
jgi:protein TonB